MQANIVTYESESCPHVCRYRVEGEDCNKGHRTTDAAHALRLPMRMSIAGGGKRPVRRLVSEQVHNNAYLGESAPDVCEC